MKISFLRPSARAEGTHVIVNVSARDLPASGAVKLGCIVLDPATGAMIEDSGRADLPAGSTAQGEISVELPEEDGRYRVLISPVEEGVDRKSVV